MASSPDQWLWDFEGAARRDGDTERVRLASFYGAANRIQSKFPKEKLALYATGRDLAQQLDEPWWEMFYEGWFIETLIFGMSQPHLALDRAMRAVVRISGPEFLGFPQRSGLEMNLAAAYSRIDPIGYETELRALFAHLESHYREFVEDKSYCAQLWSHFLIEIEDPNAVDAAFDYLRCAQEVTDQTNSAHNLKHALELVCKALYLFDREGARLQIHELAEVGEELSRCTKDDDSAVDFLVWRAVAAFWNGNETEAKGFYRQANTLRDKLRPSTNITMFFHEAGGCLNQALRACQFDICDLHTQNKTFALVQRRFDKCRLLKEMGRDFSRDAKRLRRVAAKLRSQPHWEARLASLENSST